MKNKRVLRNEMLAPPSTKIEMGRDMGDDESPEGKRMETMWTTGAEGAGFTERQEGIRAPGVLVDGVEK